MTYNKLYDIISIAIQEFNVQGNEIEETETGTWTFTIQDFTGQLQMHEDPDDNVLSLFLHIYVLPIPNKNKDKFMEELLTFNAQNNYMKYGIYENYALFSVTFQNFDLFTKDFFVVILRRYIQFLQETRADMGTRYFEASVPNY